MTKTIRHRIQLTEQLKLSSFQCWYLKKMTSCFSGKAVLPRQTFPFSLISLNLHLSIKTVFGSFYLVREKYFPGFILIWVDSPTLLLSNSFYLKENQVNLFLENWFFIDIVFPFWDILLNLCSSLKCFFPSFISLPKKNHYFMIYKWIKSPNCLLFNATNKKNLSKRFSDKFGFLKIIFHFFIFS